MKQLALFAAAIAAASMLASPAVLAKPPTNWDGLVQVKSKRLDLVYLQPGADFSGYTKVLVEPTEVAFAKNWQRDYNRGSRALATRVSNSDVQEAITGGVKAAHDIFTTAWTKGGYAVVTEPGPDVLRVKTGVVHIMVTSPDRSTASCPAFCRDAAHDPVREVGLDDGSLRDAPSISIAAKGAACASHQHPRDFADCENVKHRVR